MRAALFCGPGCIKVGERPDPVLVAPSDAVVRVVLACVCGSDLWYYRGETPYPEGAPIGHEFVGVVEQVGADVHGVAQGDLVIAPFNYCDGTCVHCRAGWTSCCVAAVSWSKGRSPTAARGRLCACPSPTAASSGSRARSLGRDNAVAAHPHRRHVHGSPRGRKPPV